MDAMMDVLADASMAASAHMKAAEILNMMCKEASAPSASGSRASGSHSIACDADADADDALHSWTREEDEILRRLVSAKAGPAVKRGPGRAPAPQLGEDDWEAISEHFEDRTPQQCAEHFQKALNPENIKGTCQIGRAHV